MGRTGLSGSGRRKLVADRMNCCCGGGYKNVNCCCCGSCSNSSHGKSPKKKTARVQFVQSERANLVRNLPCSDPAVRQREMFMSISLVLGGSEGSDPLPSASDWKAFTRECVPKCFRLEASCTGDGVNKCWSILKKKN